MSEVATFRVSGIEPTVNSRDILNCLVGLSDRRNERVVFDVIWVNDTSFLVAAVCASESEETFKEHGRLLLDALKRRFNQGETIDLFCTIVDNKPKSFWNLWGLLGTTTANTSISLEERPNKRRRLDK
jgi:hypothetical protein